MNNADSPESSTKVPASLVGWVLFVGGLASFFLFRAGFWSLLAGLAGGIILLVARIKKASSSVDAPTEDDQRSKDLKRFVSKTRYLENVGDLGEQAAEQFSQISRRFTEFKELLALKFKPEEMTFTRYYGVAEQVYLGVLDNLEMIATMLNSVDAIDPGYIEQRIAELTANGNSAEEVKNLEERKRLREQQIETVTELLSRNEKAITDFDRVSSALAATQTRKDADVGLEAAMAELARLAERAKKYDVNQS